MALFSQSKKAKTAVKGTATQKPASATSRALPTDRNLAAVLAKPRVTEKAIAAGDRNVYVFVVDRRSNKFQVRDAVKAQYNVTPVKVNIVNKAPRTYRSRSKGRTLTEHGMKKAYVYLKKGETISIV